MRGYPSKTELHELNEIVKSTGEHTATQVNSLLQSDLGVQLPLHISLSVPLVLVTGQSQDFKDTIASHINATSVSPFAIFCEGLAWVTNSDTTRHFLVLTVKKPVNNELNRLLKACNQSAADFGLPQLHGTTLDTRKSGGLTATTDDCKSRPSLSALFHVSIAWRLNTPEEGASPTAGISDLKQSLRIPIHFDAVKVKIGNEVKDLLLS